jgi:hypothetical protein
MAFLGALDLQSVDTTDQYAALPAGNYPAVLVFSEVRDTKAGTGQYLYMEMEVIEGQSKGRKIFDRLNIQNPNKVAEEIGKKQLVKLMNALGVPLDTADSAAMHGKPFSVKLKIEDDAQYGPSNSVAAYMPAAGASPAAAVPQAAAAPAAAPAANAAPAWTQQQAAG